MSLKSTDIKVYVHTNNNAPALQNTWGQLVSVLDACLINGYDAPAINSATVLDNVLTINFGVAHNLLAGQVLLISGANQTEFNRQFRIANIPTTTTVQIDIDDTFKNQPTGNITATIPPLGWVREFSSGGKRAYRNAQTDIADRPYLRVVDEIDPVWTSTYAKYAKVGIVDVMSDIDTLIGLQTPYDVAQPDKNWIGIGSGGSAVNGWAKWYYSRVQDIYVDTFFDSEGTSQSIKRWLIVGNSEWFYILPSQVDSIYPNVYFFGNLGGCYGLSSSFQYDTAANNKETTNKTALSSVASSFLLHIGTSRGFRCLGMQSAKNDGAGGSELFYEPISEGMVASDVYISARHNGKTYREILPSFKWLMNPYDATYELKTLEDNDSAFILKTVFASITSISHSAEIPKVNGLVGFKLY